jgi:hypothetical protein
MSKYKRIYQSYNDLNAGLSRAQGFYSEMKDTVSSLQKNVETFVNNRRSEGGQLLQNIEQKKSQGADHEQQRLKDLMERMSMEPSGSPVSNGSGRKKSIPAPLSSTPLNQHGYPATSSQPSYNPAASPPITPRYPMTSAPGQPQYMQPQQQQSYGSNGYNQQQPPPRRESYQTQPQHPQYPSHQPSNSQSSYNPTNYGPVSPPPHQQYFSSPPNPHNQQPWGQPQQQHGQYGGYQSSTPQPGLPQGYVPPPPPPGPPPAQQGDYGHYGGSYPSGPGGYAAQQQRGSQQGQQQQQGADPWAGLSGWK